MSILPFNIAEPIDIAKLPTGVMEYLGPERIKDTISLINVLETGKFYGLLMMQSRYDHKTEITEFRIKIHDSVMKSIKEESDA